MDRRFRIAHLITRLDLGGAQQNTLFCVANHDRRCFDVELLAGSGGYLDADAQGIDAARVQLVPWLRHPIAPWSDARAILRLRDHFRSRRIDLVHTHSSKAGVLGRVAARLAGVPAVVHTAHGWSFNRTQSAAVRRGFVAVERWSASLADRMIVVSHRDRDEGVRLGIGRPGQYAVLRSGIDVAAYRRPGRDPAATRRELGVEPHHFLVGTVACLKPQKAPDDFVRAAARAHARCERMRFVVAGDGPLRETTEASIRRHGMSGVVRLLGWRRDVADLLHAMDAFLLTSRFEGLPRAVLQAMAAGVPVVATAVDGTPEVVRDRVSGLLVPPGDPEAAAARLLELVADPGLAAELTERAASELGNGFDIHAMVRDLERIYISLLEGPG